MHNKDNLRILRQKIKKIIPKRVNVTAFGRTGFCKFGRVRGDRLKTESSIVIPMFGNQNNNWKAGS